MSSIAKVKVYVRIRPLLPRELVAQSSRPSSSCIQTARRDGDLRTIDGKEFHFDSIATEKVSQLDIYRLTVESLLVGLFKGFNATVFAFGQTGSGKTFTMGTSIISLLHWNTIFN